MVNLHHEDCLTAMGSMRDNEFDLAIVDPPYGISGALHSTKKLQGAGKLKNRAINKFDTQWDGYPPEQDYFDELFRVSKNQIIWGGNYFGDYLGRTRGIICWDKVQPWPNFSAWEMAWTSFDKVAKLIKIDNRFSGKIHPTEKPVELYSWLLNQYANDGDRILDTHLGSGASAIAAHRMGFNFDGYEIDISYYNAAKNRLKREKRQLKIWE